MMLLQRCSRWIWLAGVLALAIGGGRIAQAQDQQTPAQPAADQQQRSNQQQTPPAETSKKIKVTAIDKTQAARGAWVKFSTEGEGWPTDRHQIAIYLDGRQVGTATRFDDGGFLWQVPGCAGACRNGSELKACPVSCKDCAGRAADDPGCEDCREQITLGTHDLQVVLQKGEEELSLVPLPVSELTILGRTGGASPKITGVFPVPSYPGPLYKLSVQGEGFSETACDNDVYLGGERVDVCWQGETCSGERAALPQGHLVSTREIRLSNLSRGERELSTLAIGVGGQTSDPVNIRLSRVARRTPVWWSLIGFAAIVGLVFATTSRGFKGDPIAGLRFGFGPALLLDKETDTYSLSRFQFYVWTAVAIFGYLYLAISSSLVQGKLDFVDIPEGLPGIVFISASTSVLAQWAQSARGPKGAGNLRPSFSDLITSGGVVAPERFQFFVWTVLGAIAFVALILLRDPGTIQDLPKVPEGFLQLMGVSSVGYLGGKLARKPGPIIDEIMAKISSLELTIRGRCLSADASFRIGDEDVTSDLIAGTKEKPNKPEIVEAEEQMADPTLAKVLRLTITEPKEGWLKEKTQLTIINPDGQKATWTYTPKKE